MKITVRHFQRLKPFLLTLLKSESYDVRWDIYHDAFINNEFTQYTLYIQKWKGVEKYCIFDLGQDRNYEVKYCTQNRYNISCCNTRIMKKISEAWQINPEWQVWETDSETVGWTSILDHITASHNLPVLCQNSSRDYVVLWLK
jgi:hypothetical protein